MDTQPRDNADSGQEPPTSAGIELGQTLKRWREESNRSQNAVAKKLGARQPTVSRWESGATLPAIEAIQSLWRIRTQATETPPSDAELDRALELHQRAETERGRFPKQSAPPASPTTTASAVLPAPAETGRKRTVLTILTTSGVVVALVVAFLVWQHVAGSTQAGGADQPSTSAASTRHAPPATCSGASCTSVEPTTTVCAQDATTAYTGRSYGVHVELRYSRRCHAAWAKMSGTSPGDRITLAVGNDDENSQEYRQQTGHDAHTRMIHVDDMSGVRACAIVEGRGTVCATTKAASLRPSLGSPPG
ncbi:DUF2690 domain-containing protein [Streptomyces sp. NPDC020792]|uniref:DUF2690 domain-containing protein n=1 Tax=Streptomyces sp. NPDC020792 TaxID=3365089 RepID=UPI00378AAA25